MMSTGLWLHAEMDAGPVFRTPVAFHPPTATFRVHRCFQRHVHTHAIAHGGSVQFSLRGRGAVCAAVCAGCVPLRTHTELRAYTETTCVLLRFPECVVAGRVLLLLAPDRVRIHLSLDLAELAAAANLDSTKHISFTVRVPSVKHSVRTVTHGNLGLARQWWGVNAPSGISTMIQQVIGTLSGQFMLNYTVIWLVLMCLKSVTHSNPHLSTVRHNLS